MPTIIATSIVVGMYLGLYISPNRTASSTVARTAQTKTSYLLKLIEHNYVDSVSINDIEEKIIPEILAELDPHSVYIPYEGMSEANEALDGKFDGIGVVFNMMTDTVVVLNVISGGPSFKAGIIAGDRIIKAQTLLGAYPQTRSGCFASLYCCVVLCYSKRKAALH